MSTGTSTKKIQSQTSSFMKGSTMESHYFRIDRNDGTTRISPWYELARFETLEEAQLALADSVKFPMSSSLRIVEVTEKVVSG